jgi:hypothetical protein
MRYIDVPNALVPHRERAGMYTQRLGKIKNKPVKQSEISDNKFIIAQMQ